MYVVATIIGLLVGYEILVHLLNRRSDLTSDELHEDARKQRIRQLGKLGDVE